MGNPAPRRRQGREVRSTEGEWRRSLTSLPQIPDHPAVEPRDKFRSGTTSAGNVEAAGCEHRPALPLEAASPIGSTQGRALQCRIALCKLRDGIVSPPDVSPSGPPSTCGSRRGCRSDAGRRARDLQGSSVYSCSSDSQPYPQPAGRVRILFAKKRKNLTPFRMRWIQTQRGLQCRSKTQA